MSGRGAFTGDVLMSGYGLARNSSKVMAPPGGKCSDIFGTGASYAEPKAQNPTIAQVSRNESTVFRSPRSAPVADHTAAAASRRGQSQVFSAEPASPMRQAPHSAAAPDSQVFEAETAPGSPMRRVNPEAMSFDQQQANVRSIQTSTRVVQPPGGRCSNIFG